MPQALPSPDPHSNRLELQVYAMPVDATVASYRSLGIPVLAESSSSVTFQFGPMNLHVDEVANLGQAEIWLEFIVSDMKAAADDLERARFVRCDEVESLPADFPGFWVAGPSSIVHLVPDRE